MKIISQCALLIMLCTYNIASYALERGDILPPRIPNINITDGYETNSIELELRQDGSIQKVYTKTCSSCSPQAYTTTAETKFYLGSKTIQIQRAVSYNGKSGSIVFYPKTLSVVSVRFFDLED